MLLTDICLGGDIDILAVLPPLHPIQFHKLKPLYRRLRLLLRYALQQALGHNVVADFGNGEGKGFSGQMLNGSFGNLVYSPTAFSCSSVSVDGSFRFLPVPAPRRFGEYG